MFDWSRIENPLGAFVGVGFVILLAITSARSQRPSPSEGKDSQPQQTQTPASQQTTTTYPRGTEQTPLIVRSVKSEKEAADDAKERKDKAANDWTNTVFTGLVAVATILQFFALIAIIRTTRRQLRAYVMVEGVDINIHDIDDDRWVIGFKIINTGQTPAYDVKIVSKTKMLTHPVAGNFDFFLEEGDDPSIGMLGPSRDLEHDSTSEKISLDSMEITDPGSSERLYTWGYVTYRHAFQRRWSRRRYTNFCQFIVEGNYVAHASQHHNDAN
jgi:hypothetical protein